MPSYFHALMFHTEHLAEGHAYLKDCPYCEIGPTRGDSQTAAIDRFYSAAQKSGRKSVPLSEMP